MQFRGQNVINGGRPVFHEEGPFYTLATANRVALALIQDALAVPVFFQDGNHIFTYTEDQVMGTQTVTSVRGYGVATRYVC